jgi:hypothetical protein
MSEEITDLIKQVRLSTDFQVNKRILKEKIQTDLHFAHNGGMFKITPELLAFVQSWPIDELYLEDVYENPVAVDKQVFLIMAQQHYHRVMNDWHTQYEELRKIRKV